MMPSILTVQRQELRCRILKVLDAQRPRAIADSILLRVLNADYAYTTDEEMQEALHYLREKRLIRTVRQLPMEYALTAEGMDVCDGSVESPSGVLMDHLWRPSDRPESDLLHDFRHQLSQLEGKLDTLNRLIDRVDMMIGRMLERRNDS